jgi:hypothetical protein
MRRRSVHPTGVRSAAHGHRGARSARFVYRHRRDENGAAPEHLRSGPQPLRLRTIKTYGVCGGDVDDERGIEASSASDAEEPTPLEAAGYGVSKSLYRSTEGAMSRRSTISKARKRNMG